MSFSLKVIAYLQNGPWKFWKLENSPFLPPPGPSPVFPGAAVQSLSPAPWRARPAALRFALAPTRRPRAPPPPLASRCALPCRATRPRRAQSRPRGRHRDAAVESPLQSSPPFPIARTGTTKTPASYSSPPFAFSVLPHLRTPPPPRLNADELTLAAEPPHRRSSARSDPLASTASPSRNSQTISPRPNPTGATPPPCSELHRPPLAVDRPPPALISRPKSIQRTASASTPFSPTYPSPPVSLDAGIGRHTPRYSLTLARTSSSEFEKLQGAVCEALDSVE